MVLGTGRAVVWGQPVDFLQMLLDSEQVFGIE
jgi:hypothetical protein